MLSSSNTMPSRELPPEREVDCACPWAMQRPVLRDHTGVNRRVTACLRCGAVNVTDSIVEEPHPHDVRCVANVVLDVAPAALEWLAAFPRLAGPAWGWRDPIYLPADSRAEDEAELEALEARAKAAQAALAPAERLERAGLPEAPPPELPEGLARFSRVWSDAALRQGKVRAR